MHLIINRNYLSLLSFNRGAFFSTRLICLLIVHDRSQELSQIEPLPPLTEDEEKLLEDSVLESFSPISPSADRTLIKALGSCDQEFRLSVSHEGNNVLWDLSEFAKAGKLLKTPPMDVEFYDEYEMRKVYSLIYDVFRCKYTY